MSPMLEWFAAFALVVFSVCCVAALLKLINECWSHVQYQTLRNDVAKAALEIERLWPDEAIPARDVYAILALLAHRRILDLESMREEQDLTRASQVTPISDVELVRIGERHSRPLQFGREFSEAQWLAAAREIEARAAGAGGNNGNA